MDFERLGFKRLDFGRLGFKRLDFGRPGFKKLERYDAIILIKARKNTGIAFIVNITIFGRVDGAETLFFHVLVLIQ